MRIPRTLKIGAREVKIVYKKVIENDPRICGMAVYTKGEIWLRKGMEQKAKEATLLHEIGHFCNSTMSHAVWDSLAEQLYATLKINKMLK